MLAGALSPVSLIRVRLLLCRAKGVVKNMPDTHYVDHRIEILNHDKDYNSATVYEIAEARYSLLPSKAK